MGTLRAWKDREEEAFPKEDFEAVVRDFHTGDNEWSGCGPEGEESDLEGERESLAEAIWVSKVARSRSRSWGGTEWMSTGSLRGSDGCCLGSTCRFMDWKEDTCEFLEEEGGWSVLEERESELAVGNDAIEEETVDDGVAVDEDEEDERLDESFLDWCLVEREEELEEVEDDVDGCL